MHCLSPTNRVRVRICCVLWSNVLLLLYVYLCVPVPAAVLAFSTINCTLVILACVGLTSNIAFFIMPNIVLKFVLIIFLLFIGCLSLDSIHIKLRREIDKNGAEMAIAEEETVSLSSSTDPILKAFLTSQKDPLFIFWIMCFVLLLTAELRMFFSECYKILFHQIHSEDAERGDAKPAPPPTYSYCVKRADVEELPSYSQAVSVAKPTSGPRSSICGGEMPQVQRRIERARCFSEPSSSAFADYAPTVVLTPGREPGGEPGPEPGLEPRREPPQEPHLRSNQGGTSGTTSAQMEIPPRTAVYVWQP